MGSPIPGNPSDRITGQNIALAYQSVYGATAQTRLKGCPIHQHYGFHQRSSPNRHHLGRSIRMDKPIGIPWPLDGYQTYYLAGVKYCYINPLFHSALLNLGGNRPSSPLGATLRGQYVELSAFGGHFRALGVNGSAFRVTYTWARRPGRPLGRDSLCVQATAIGSRTLRGGEAAVLRVTVLVGVSLTLIKVFRAALLQPF